MDPVDAGLILAGLVALVAILVYWADRLSGGRERCRRCGALKVSPEASCGVCEAPFDAPAGTPTTEEPAMSETKTTRRDPPEPTVDPDAGVLNPGVQPWMVQGAFIMMMIGLGTRLLGMLQPAGLDLGIPTTLTTVLTVLGGIGMFVGFVVLDVA